VPSLCENIVASHGAIINIDFSASDARQLTCRRRKQANPRRTLGSVTGISDVPLLPPLFARGEKRETVEQLCFAAFHLLKRRGLRPVGFNCDDLRAWCDVVLGCVEAVWPGLVRRIHPSRAEEVDAHLASGGIVYHAPDKLVLGFEMGQDALRWYQRLLSSVNFCSQARL